MTVAEFTAPERWRAAFSQHPAATMDPLIGRLLVVAAHPDDETLGAGGFLRAVHAAGGRVRLVVATDGEAAFPAAGPADRAALARTRREELDRALDALGLDGIPVHRLGLPDSGLAGVEHELVEALRPLAADADTCLAPWPLDPHPDHAAAGRAALAAAPAGAHRFGYPIWTWPWGDPDDPRLPWADAFVHRHDPETRQAKQRAVQCHVSQLQAPAGGGAPILPPAVLAHFDTGSETFFRIPRTASAPVERFAELYRDGRGDPWRTRTSWYERRKLAVLLAALPAQRYRHAAEPGCGTGELTRLLATRCDAVTASDFTAGRRHGGPGGGGRRARRRGRGAARCPIPGRCPTVSTSWCAARCSTTSARTTSAPWSSGSCTPPAPARTSCCCTGAAPLPRLRRTPGPRTAPSSTIRASRPSSSTSTPSSCCTWCGAGERSGRAVARRSMPWG